MKIILSVVFTTLTIVSAVPHENYDERIVGGEDIPIEKVPYQISLEYNGRHVCGGSVVAPNYIVTAAHCTDEKTENKLSIRAGSSLREQGGQVINIKKIHSHPKFSMSSIDYDIAILELAENLEFNDKVGTIALPSRSQYWPPGTEVLVTGWGVLHLLDEFLPLHLQGVTVELIDRNTCIDYYGGVTERMFCAGVEGGGKDACTDDSGGPLQVNGTLVGVVSWGIGCALPNSPGVYTNVSVLFDFIEEITGL